VIDLAAARKRGQTIPVDAGAGEPGERAAVLAAKPRHRSSCRCRAERDVYVLPGRTVEMPGRVRLSLTASDAMIDQALPVLAAAIAEAGQTS
jgi:hypothetical protein